jgi:hypothetical protein
VRRLAVVIALSAAGVAAASAGAAGAPAPVRVGCDAGGPGAAAIHRARDVTLGPLVIMEARRTVGATRDAFAGHGFKLPVTVPDGATVTLSVPHAWRSRVGLVFTLAAQDRAVRRGVAGADRAVRFTACPAGAQPGRTGWPGGLVVDRPRCVTLVATVAGGPAVRRRVPLGRRC